MGFKVWQSPCLGPVHTGHRGARKCCTKKWNILLPIGVFTQHCKQLQATSKDLQANLRANLLARPVWTGPNTHHLSSHFVERVLLRLKRKEWIPVWHQYLSRYLSCSVCVWFPREQICDRRNCFRAWTAEKQDWSPNGVRYMLILSLTTISWKPWGYNFLPNQHSCTVNSGALIGAAVTENQLIFVVMRSAMLLTVTSDLFARRKHSNRLATWNRKRINSKKEGAPDFSAVLVLSSSKGR